MSQNLTAEQRGLEMMLIPVKDIPPLAQKFARALCQELGMCCETLLTAWTVYAQCAEGLTCQDPLYLARPKDIAWFEREGK